MNVERRVLRSVSEFSMFKYLLFFYLIFFVISVILMTVIGFIAWFSLSSLGFDINSIMSNLGLDGFDIFNFFGGGTAVTIVVFIFGGLIASVFYAAFGTFVVWIMNVVLRISGGIELRFLPEKEETVSIKKPE